MKTNGIVYDAAATSRILGLPAKCGAPAPQAAEGEVVVCYGGWDLKQLRSSAAGERRMWQDQDWYEKYGWKAEPGYYRLLLAVPGSNRQNWSEQLDSLAAMDAAWQAAPVCVAVTALLVHLTETGDDLLMKKWCRCAEGLPNERRAGSTVSHDRVYVSDHWDGYRIDLLWLSAARRA